MVPICTEWWCTEANEATQTHCYNPVAPAYPIWAHWARALVTVLCYLCVLKCLFIIIIIIMRMNDNTDAKRILLASPPADWRRQPGRPRITWLSTVQQDLKHHFTFPESADLAQNRPLWRMMSTYGATQSCVACQKRRRRLFIKRLCSSHFMALWRRHLTGWQPVHQCCFPSLPAVECGFIWCDLLSNCKHTAIVRMCNK